MWREIMGLMGQAMAMRRGRARSLDLLDARRSEKHLVSAELGLVDTVLFNDAERMALGVAIHDVRRRMRARNAWFGTFDRYPDRPLANRQLESLRRLGIAILASDPRGIDAAVDAAVQAGIAPNKLEALLALDMKVVSSAGPTVPADQANEARRPRTATCE